MNTLRAARIVLPAAAIFCSFLHAQDADSAALSRTRDAFLQVIDRPRVPLAPEIQELPALGNFPREHFTYAADEKQRVPGILLKPARLDARRPVVIVLHGTGGKKEGELSWLKQLCEKGFIAVAIDGRYHGERTRTGSGDGEYDEAIHRVYKTGGEHPLYWDTVWDVMRLIDYLESRTDVDAKHIGLIGFSKGGIETFYAAAADPRIAVAVPCIGVQTFRWGLEHDAFKARLATVQKAVNAISKDEGMEINVDFAHKFFDHLVPGIYGQFDGPAILPLIAPRPLLVINGGADANTPLPGVNEAADAARDAYRSANAEEKFVLRIQEKVGHAVNAEAHDAAIAWLVKWLAP